MKNFLRLWRHHIFERSSLRQKISYLLEESLLCPSFFYMSPSSLLNKFSQSIVLFLESFKFFLDSLSGYSPERQLVEKCQYHLFIYYDTNNTTSFSIDTTIHILFASLKWTETYSNSTHKSLCVDFHQCGPLSFFHLYQLSLNVYIPTLKWLFWCQCMMDPLNLYLSQDWHKCWF